MHDVKFWGENSMIANGNSFFSLDSLSSEQRRRFLQQILSQVWGKKKEEKFSLLHPYMQNRTSKRKGISKQETQKGNLLQHIYLLSVYVWQFLLLLIVGNWLDYIKICFICMRNLFTMSIVLKLFVVLGRANKIELWRLIVSWKLSMKSLEQTNWMFNSDCSCQDG